MKFFARDSGSVRPARVIVLLLGVTALAPVAPDTATAQPIVGIVVEEGNGLPIAGAMIVLLDDDGNRVDRMLTNAAGRFTLEPRLPGPHYITVERIGYANLTTPRFDPASSRDLMTIEVPVEAILLRRLDVTAGRRCEVRPEEGRATAQVWEEVRKALAAEAWTREAGLYRYTLLRFERRLDRYAENVLSDVAQIAEDRDAAFSSVAIESLAEQGFVQAEGDSMTVYYAPDAEALLSDPFLDTHCFGLTDEAEGLIGLTFEPIQDRRVPDIVGVLWLDEATAELDRLAYQYVNLLQSSEIGEPGGEVYFARLPNGAWIVRQWTIRMPVLDAVTPWHTIRLGYREEGGVTDAITDARGRKVLDARSASVFGVVLDSVGNAPPATPRGLEIVGTRRMTLSDSDGSFLFNELPPGTHNLRVVAPGYSRLGIAVPETPVEAELGEVAYVRLRAPSLDDVLAYSCGAGPRPEGTASVLGRIVTASGASPAGLRVAAAWPAATGYAAAPIAAPLRPDGEAGASPVWTPGRDGHYATAETSTDERGLFLLCNVPKGSRVRLAVTRAAGAAGRAAEAPDVPLALETLFVPPDLGAVLTTLTVSTIHDNMYSALYNTEHCAARYCLAGDHRPR